MSFDLERAVQVLSRTPGALAALLSGLDDAWLHADEGEGTFSPFEVVAHMLEAERTNWLPRARLLRTGASTFPAFDRYAHRRLHAGRPLDELLAEFAAARRESLAEVASWGLTEVDLAVAAAHPELGAVTLG